jgi:hypothetical protein
LRSELTAAELGLVVLGGVLASAGATAHFVAVSLLLR